MLPAAPLACFLADALERYGVVSLGEMHCCREEHEAIRHVLALPDIVGRLDDIVVEFATAAHQDILDAYVEGEAVNDEDLPQLWRDTTQAMLPTWDSPLYRQLLAHIREVNVRVGSGAGYRVRAGDPPVPWSTARTRADLEAGMMGRDAHAAEVISESVRAGRRVLVIYGALHLIRRRHLTETGRTAANQTFRVDRWPRGTGSITDRLERDRSIRCTVVVPRSPSTDPYVDELCPVGEVRMLAGTAAAEAPVADLYGDVFRGGERVPPPTGRWADIADAWWNLGPSLTLIPPETSPEWEAERQRRAQLWRPGAGGDMTRRQAPRGTRPSRGSPP